PLTTWEVGPEGDLHGTLEMPLAVGIVGGATRTNPIAKLALKILGVKSARELAEVMAAVGLVQNLAALRALAAEGIQAGHMSLHAKNIAVMAGAEGDEIDLVAEEMVREKVVRVDKAQEILTRLRNKKP
ncbi:MAG: 3-hydroxy-3-methylglutaryl-CoA reductase, partial [Nitrososphaerota archaeon]